jgi:hypothetical protein
MKVETRYDPSKSVVGELSPPGRHRDDRDLYLSTNVILDLRDIAAEAIECTASFDSSYAQDSTGYSYEAALLKRMAADWWRTAVTLPPHDDQTPDWGLIKDISAAWIEYLMWIPTAQRFWEISWRLEKASMGTPYEDLFCVSEECLDSRATIEERVPEPWVWIVEIGDQASDSDPWETPDAKEWAEAWYDMYWMVMLKSPTGELAYGTNAPDLHATAYSRFIVEGAGDTNKIENESPVWSYWDGINAIGVDIPPQVVGPAMLFYTTDRDRNRRVVINWR